MLMEDYVEGQTQKLFREIRKEWQYINLVIGWYYADYGSWSLWAD
jgi:hypothetical protein